MDDLISRQAAIDAINQICPIDTEYDCTLLDRVDVRCVLTDLPSARSETDLDEVVSQIKWERDVAVQQLKDLGYSLGEKPKQKIGKWNVYYHGINEMPSFSYSCNQCGYSAPYGLYGGKYEQKKWRFCPNCGAKMEG